MTNQFAKSTTNPTRRSMIVTTGLAAAGGLGLKFGLTAPAWAADEAPVFMFVQSSQDLIADQSAMTLTLVNVNPQTIYFSDRPERIAGHLMMEKYLAEWTPAVGPDNFSANPPNASLSVYEPGQENNSLAVVEISNPRLSGSDLTYDYKLLQGVVPANGGVTTLFIDRIGLGGGVGVGFHGVGVGRRGPGVF